MMAWHVFRKEVQDALRDRKTLIAVLLSSVIAGPVLLAVLSTVFAQIESRADKREVTVSGLAYAPQLRNYFERQTYTVKEAPADYAEQLSASQLGEAVVVVPPDFEALLDAGETPRLAVVTDSANRNAQISAGNASRLLQGFVREQAQLALMVRGVPTSAISPIAVETHNLASAASRSSQFSGMVPFFVLMAVLYGALNAALDSTAGERERGSLEPLLATPTARWQIVLGKWGAVALIGMVIALCSVLSFFPAQWFLKSEMLAAMFQFGPQEGIRFLALLVPFAAALAAALMAVAIRCKNFKEAQASATFLILGVNMLPLVTLFDPSGEKWWHLWVPGLAQQTVMLRVLKGEVLYASHLTIPLLSCALLTGVCLYLVTRNLERMAIK